MFESGTLHIPQIQTGVGWNVIFLFQSDIFHKVLMKPDPPPPSTGRSEFVAYCLLQNEYIITENLF